MQADAVFPSAARERGMYESFYLRAVSPTEPVGVWVRYTVHKRPGSDPRGSLWCTVFDAQRGAPFMHKLTTADLSVSPGGWIAVGDAQLGPGRAEGRCGEASWSLTFDSDERELRHLPSAWMYRAKLPRTKLTSPLPDARFQGTFALPDRPALQLDGWRGMVGHNWGAEHAERWIWLHGVDFDPDRTAWLDVALGRIMIAGRRTPWVANGAFSREGHRTQLGGLAKRGLIVRESSTGCTLRLPGERGLRLDADVSVPRDSAAGWRYADPDGSEHEIVNCSVAELTLTVTGADGVRRSLHTPHGAAYELGMRPGELHDVPIAPFPDG